MPMNPEIKSKWIAALESGEYKQGTMSLRTVHNTFCCLGVLCDLHRKEVPKYGWKQELGEWFYDGRTGVPPNVVEEWSGLHDGDHKQNLITMNDNGSTFPEIAAYIKENL